MSDDRPTNERPERRWHPGRWMFGATLLIVVALGLMVALKVRAHRALLARFAAHRGELTIEPVGPHWLGKVVPLEWRQTFGTVTAVRFYALGDPSTLPLTDGALIELVDDLSNVECVIGVHIARASELSGRGVRTLQRLENLESLSIEWGPVDDRGFVDLARHLPRLRQVSLVGTTVGDATARELARLPELTHLALDDTAIGDEGAIHLAKVPTLRWLSLSGTYVTDASVNELARRIPDLQITDD